MANVISVNKPLPGAGGCWAILSRYRGRPPHQGTPCGLAPRPGFLTCQHHADFEDRAQRIKQAIENVDAKP